ncbi:MAG: threonine synthase [Actinomycetota bacterium]|jgi:threonine synthase|nr:threonine synthase [Actinomycetota bacterium]
MANVLGLRCRECGREYAAAPIFTCEWCFGPLEVAYDYDAITASVSREKIAAGPLTLWRYADLLPVAPDNAVDLGTGFTPLVRADRLAAELGLGEVWLKNDTRNPTNSFKDRVSSVALSKALEFGFKVAACASTGNLANSVAAHAARAGMRSYVFIPSDLEQGKIVTTAVYGGNLVAIKGNYDDVNRLCAELASIYEWAFVNVNMRPYYAEGSKTLAFETAEQLGWSVPDHVVVPVASGSLLTKIRKGFDELYKVGLLDEEPHVRVSGAQALGCSPVAKAFIEKADTIRPVKPDTIAKSLAIGNPADGYFALDVVRTTGGAFATVTDDEIVEGIRLLARTEGIFAETAGGVTVATLKKLASEGVVRSDERVVVYITGHGLKTIEAVSPTTGPTATIAPTLDAFHEAFDIEES